MNQGANTAEFPVTSVTYTDVDEAAAAVKGADVEICQSGRGQYWANFLSVPLGTSHLQAMQDRLATLTRGSVSRASCGFVLTVFGVPGVSANGHELDGSRLVYYGPGAEAYAACRGPTMWVTFALPPAELHRAMSALAGAHWTPPAGESRLICPERKVIKALRETVAEALTLATKQPQVLASEQVRADVHQRLLTAFAQAMASDGGGTVARTQLSHARVIARCEEYLRQHLDQPVYLIELCEAAGASERSLRDIFQEFYGMSPMRYLKVRRLNQIRRELMRADPSRTNVTKIAMSLGVWELGRFAGEYRAMFGETPSQTLRGQR